MSFSGICGDKQQDKVSVEGEASRFKDFRYILYGELSINWTHISIQSEIPLSSILPCDDTVPAVHSCNHRPLKLLGCHDLNRHDRFQDGGVGLLHC